VVQQLGYATHTLFQNGLNALNFSRSTLSNGFSRHYKPELPGFYKHELTLKELNMKKIIIIMALILSLFVLVGCTTTAVSTPTTSAPASSDPNSITNIVWKWQTLNDTVNGSTRVDDPNKYTITFRDDGTTTGLADCNTFSGTYSQDGGFTIVITPDAMSACTQPSMDQQFLTLLEQVVAGGPDGAGGLTLQTAGGAQSLLFSNGGAAP
jgi:heat shock protein HslJ